MKVYYAHFMGIYNTPQEKRDIELLEKLGYEVLNPNTPETQNEVKHYKEVFKDHKDGYMKMFEEVFFTKVRNCEVFAFRALPNGRIPGGVYMELEHAKLNNKLIIELPSSISSRRMSVDETREYLQEIGQR